MKKKQVEPDKILVRCVQVAQSSTRFTINFRFLGEWHQSFYLHTDTAPEWVPGKTYELILGDAE